MNIFKTIKSYLSSKISFIDFNEDDIDLGHEIKRYLDLEKYKKFVEYSGDDLKDVPEEYRSEYVCLAAVRDSVWALEHVKNQTYEMCFEAVSRNGLSIQFVKNQSTNLCLIAVNQEARSLRYIKNQTEEICHAAIIKDSISLQYVKNQTPEICLFSLSKDPSCLFCVRDLSSIALLLDDAFIEGNIRIHPEYEEIKVIKARMLMTQLASDSINSNDVMTNNRKSKAGI